MIQMHIAELSSLVHFHGMSFTRLITYLPNHCTEVWIKPPFLCQVSWNSVAQDPEHVL
jgi:hypothetical protein